MLSVLTRFGPTSLTVGRPFFRTVLPSLYFFSNNFTETIIPQNRNNNNNNNNSNSNNSNNNDINIDNINSNHNGHLLGGSKTKTTVFGRTEVVFDLDLALELMKATKFAAEKHRNQKRKDKAGTPYINHPIGVANILLQTGRITNLHIIQAALLHDTVEDTDTTFDEILTHFGPTVMGLVEELTDDFKKPKLERKLKRIHLAPQMSVGAKLIKISDLIHNLTDILYNTPPNWQFPRVQGYFVWAHKVYQGLKGVNQPLEKELENIFYQSTYLVDGELTKVLPPSAAPHYHQIFQQYILTLKDVD